MKNLELELSGVQSLNSEELKSVDGGIVCGGLCIAGVVILAGALGIGVGYGIAAAID